MKKGVLEYRAELANLLKGIPWKEVNQKFKNDFDAALEYILADMEKGGKEELDKYTQLLVEEVKKLNLKKLGKKITPPKGY